MNEPQAIWSMSLIVFDKEISLTQNVILSQGRSALISTVHRIDHLRKIIQDSPIKNAGINPDIAPTISEICYQAGLASTILFNNGRRGNMESIVAYKLRLERLKYVNYFCQEQKLEPITLNDRKLRNSLTHIDEHLADILTLEPNKGWFIDTAVGSKNEFLPPAGISVGYCRAYAIQEDVLIHLGNELKLADLRSDCCAVLKVVFGVDVDQK